MLQTILTWCFLKDPLGYIGLIIPLVVIGGLTVIIRSSLVFTLTREPVVLQSATVLGSSLSLHRFVGGAVLLRLCIPHLNFLTVIKHLYIVCTLVDVRVIHGYSVFLIFDD